MKRSSILPLNNKKEKINIILNPKRSSMEFPALPLNIQNKTTKKKSDKINNQFPDFSSDLECDSNSEDSENFSDSSNSEKNEYFSKNKFEKNENFNNNLNSKNSLDQNLNEKIDIFLNHKIKIMSVNGLFIKQKVNIIEIIGGCQIEKEFQIFEKKKKK